MGQDKGANFERGVQLSKVGVAVADGPFRFYVGYTPSFHCVFLDRENVLIMVQQALRD